MPALIRETNTALRLIVLGAYGIAVVLGGAGIWLVYLGATGTSEMTLFGAQLKSTSAGVTGLFLAAITAISLVRRSLRTLDIAVQREASSEAGSGRLPDVWPTVMTRKALEAKLRTLSDTQWGIMQAAEWHDGKAVHHLAKACHLGPSEFFHRLRSLHNDQLVIIHEGNVYLSADVKKVIGRKKLTELRSPASAMQPTGFDGG